MALAVGGGAGRATAEAAGAIFVDRATAMGLDYHHFNGASGELYYVEITSPGGALFDYDNDGDLDVYVVQGTMLADRDVSEALSPPRYPHPLTDRLYRNDPTRRSDGSFEPSFTDVTRPAGLIPSAYGMGAATGDYDHDGWVDLYVTNLGSNQLLHNNGDGTFSDVTERSGTDDLRWSISATFFDYDRDGLLDLYVVNYVDFIVAKHKLCPSPTGARDYCGPLAYRPVVDRLFRNSGDGTFKDVSTTSGINAAARTGLGVVAADFNGDDWPDLYVTNDGTANQLYINNRDGTFIDDAMLAGAAVNAEGKREASMGVDAADFDADGDLDLFLTHLTGETNTLYVNGGAALFRDRTTDTGLATPSWRFTGFGTRFFDYDNDGWLDLFAVNGAVAFFATGAREALAQTNQLFHNRAGQRFEEVTASAGEAFQLSEVSRGAAIGDLDNDGDIDLLVLNNDGPARLLMNQVGAANDWLGLALSEGEPQRSALGALVRLQQEGLPAPWRRVRTDGSYATASDPRLLFGLAGLTDRERAAVIHWPGGKRLRLEGLPAGRYLRVTTRD